MTQNSDRTGLSRAHEAAPHRVRAGSGDLTELARVLREHALVWDETYRCCGSACSEWRGSPEDHERHVSEAVLASGVVVSADRVRALADDLLRSARQCAGSDYGDGARDGYRNSVEHLRALLSEPATETAVVPLLTAGATPCRTGGNADAAPNGEARVTGLTAEALEALPPGSGVFDREGVLWVSVLEQESWDTPATWITWTTFSEQRGLLGYGDDPERFVAQRGPLRRAVSLPEGGEPGA